MKSTIRHYSSLVAILVMAVSALAQSSITPNNQGIITTLVKPATARAGMLAVTQPIGFTTSIVASGTSGEFYFASPYQNRVYKVLANGQLEIVAGSAEEVAGNTGDGGPATEALLQSPSALAIDGDHNLYFCDDGNRRIRKVDAAGIISAVPIDVFIPKAMTTDSAGNLYVVEAGRYRILKVTPVGDVTTVAGSGTEGFSGDGGSALLAQISPEGIATDSSGNLYFAEARTNRVRKVSANGIISTFAGTGAAGSGGDGGPVTSAQLNHPEDVATDAAGNLYIADYFNNLVRKVDSHGIIQTVAGTRSGIPTIFGGLLGGFGGDNGPATAAQLNLPIKLSVDEAGTIYIADTGNRRIRSVSADGIMHTVAGNGGAATDFSPRYVATDAAANVYVTPLSGGIVQKINADGSLTTVAGNGDFGFSGDSGPAVQAALSNPEGLAVDRDGNLYIADSSNDRIRKVTPDGLISTVAGSGFSGFGGDGGPALAADLAFPTAVAIDDDGNLYIADTGNERVRKVTPDGIIHTVAGNGTAGFAGDGAATALPLSNPNGLAVEHSGALLISDGYNFRIRRLTPDGQIHTIAGNGQSASPLVTLPRWISSGTVSVSASSCGRNARP